MVEADLLGYDTHGVFRLRQYVNRLRDGGCNPAPRVRVVRETAATALVDGDNGLGHLAMTRARDLAMEKARAAGIGWVGVRGGNHAGPAALYVRPQAAARMIGLAGAVGSANHVAPFGGTDILLGTNPIAVAAPGGDDPFVLDMATTVAAVGKIKLLAQRGEPMPEGWMVGRDGKPLTDPARRDEGFLLPIGGAKGYGLGLAIGLLAGVLNGAASRQRRRRLHPRHRQPDQHRPVRRRDRHRRLRRSGGVRRRRGPRLRRDARLTAAARPRSGAHPRRRPRRRPRPARRGGPAAQSRAPRRAGRHRGGARHRRNGRAIGRKPPARIRLSRVRVGTKGRGGGPVVRSGGDPHISH